MKYAYLAVMLLFVFLFGGCANTETKRLPDYARVMERGSSAPHPDAMKQDGDSIVVFHVMIPPEFVVLETEKPSFDGVWPIIAKDMFGESSLLEEGFCYSEGLKNLGEVLFVRGECVMIGATKNDFKNYRFILANKDGGVWLASPFGGRVLSEGQSEGRWDFGRFENENAYQKGIFEKIGFTLEEIDEAWQSIVGVYGFRVQDVKEIEMSKSSSDWKEFKERYTAELGYGLQLPSGERVVSNFSRDKMVQLLAHNPLMTPKQRFLQHLNVSIGTPKMMIFGTLSSILKGGIAATIDSEWRASVARGTVQRKDLAPHIRHIWRHMERIHREMRRFQAAAKR